jgi:hypothetical protein
MPLTGSLLFVYICIDVGDPVEGRVGMPFTGSLMVVYILSVNAIYLSCQRSCSYCFC